MSADSAFMLGEELVLDGGYIRVRVPPPK